MNDLKEIYIKEIRYYKNGDVNDDCKDDSIFEIKKLGKQNFYNIDYGLF